MSPSKRKKSSASMSSASPPTQVNEGDQLLNKDGTRRKSRVLRRKTDHSIIERRRREKINEKLVALQNLVPACRKECQDLIERKFVLPLQESEDNLAQSNPATERNRKRRREEEKLNKAKTEMTVKIRTSMVLEKLCIISHTLDFVEKLQEDNNSLRTLCQCQAERRASISSDVELNEHYRSAHTHDGSREPCQQHSSDALCVFGEAKRHPQSSSPTDQEPQDEWPGPAKRRLHWGSDSVREASIRNDVCRHQCGSAAQGDQCPRSESLSPSKVEASCFSVGDKREHYCSILPNASDSEANACHSFCRTQHACCREETQGSEISSDASDDRISPPPCPVMWPPVRAHHQTRYVERQRLPPIMNLDLPKRESRIFASRRDTIASLYRKGNPRPFATDASFRLFLPLSLYTSHGPPPALPSTKE